MINKRTKKNTTNCIEIQTNVASTSKLTTKCDVTNDETHRT